jgi:predicted acylesterase/phospholipase RssA
MAKVTRPIVILSIDGGGTRGIIPALVLQSLDRLISARSSNVEERENLIGYFDVVAGTSTGAIIAAGLAGKSDDAHVSGLDQLVEFYKNDAIEVFSEPLGNYWFPRSIARKLSGVFAPMFSKGQQTLKQKLKNICRDATLSSSAANLVIPAFTGNGAFIFRGGPDWPTGIVPDYLLQDVLLATTAAPCVFPPARITRIGHPAIESFIDGGVFANNPALHAYLDARQLFGNRREILLISNWLNPRAGLPLFQACMRGQSNDTHSILQQLIPDPHSYIRLDIQADSQMPAFYDASPAAMRTFEDLALKMISQNSELLEDLASRLAQIGKTARSDHSPK